MKLLVAEDDRALGRFLCKGLEDEKYVVDVAHDGADAAELSDQHDYDLLVLDLALPSRSGFDILEHVRRHKPALPVLMLTGHDSMDDRIRAFDMGADDFVAKPFSFVELTARTHALLKRREHGHSHGLLQVADLELSRFDHKATRAGRPLDLTRKEFALLEFLMRNTGRCVTRAMIIEHVWNMTFDTSTNVVDIHINYLRGKVDKGFEPKLIHTVRGAGYRLTATPATKIS